MTSRPPRPVRVGPARLCRAHAVGTAAGARSHAPGRAGRRAAARPDPVQRLLDSLPLRAKVAQLVMPWIPGTYAAADDPGFLKARALGGLAAGRRHHRLDRLAARHRGQAERAAAARAPCRCWWPPTSRAARRCASTAAPPSPPIWGWRPPAGSWTPTKWGGSPPSRAAPSASTSCSRRWPTSTTTPPTRSSTPARSATTRAPSRTSCPPRCAACRNTACSPPRSTFPVTATPAPTPTSRCRSSTPRGAGSTRWSWCPSAPPSRAAWPR